MRLFKQKGVIASLGYMLLLAGMLSVALLQNTSLSTMLDSQLASKTNAISSELAAIEANPEGESFILEMNMSPEEAVLLADTYLLSLELYYNLAVHLNDDLVHYDLVPYSDEQNTIQASKLAGEDYTLPENLTRQESYDYYETLHDYESTAKNAILAILDGHNTGLNSILDSEKDEADIFKDLVEFNASEAGTRDDPLTSAYLSAVTGYYNQLIEDYNAGKDLTLSVDNFTGFDFTMANPNEPTLLYNEKRSFLDSVIDNNNSMQLPHDEQTIESAAQGDTVEKITLNRDTVKGYLDDVNYKIDTEVAASELDGNHKTNITEADLISQIDIDSSGYPNKYTELQTELAKQNNLVTDAAEAWGTEVQAYFIYLRIWTEQSDYNMDYIDWAYSLINVAESADALQTSLLASWGTLEGYHGILLFNSSMSDEIYDQYISLIPDGEVYLTSSNKAEALGYDSSINGYLSAHLLPTTSKTVEDLSVLNDAFETASDSSTADTESLITIYNATTQSEFNHWEGKANNLKADFDLKVSNAGTALETNTSALETSFDDQKTDIDNLALTSDISITSSLVDDVTTRTGIVTEIENDYNSLLGIYNNLATAVRDDMSGIVSADLAAAQQNQLEADAAINVAVTASLNDGNDDTSLTTADIIAELNTDNNGKAYASTDIYAKGNSVSLGRYDSLVQGATNLQALQNDLNNNLLSSLTDAASYDTAKENYLDASQSHLDASNNDKNFIVGFNFATFAAAKESSWDAYEADYTKLVDYNALSNEVYVSYLSDSNTAPYLTDPNAANYYNLINSAYNNEVTSAVVASDSYIDIDTAKARIYGVVNTTVTTNLNLLLGIFNDTIYAEFSAHYTAGDDHNTAETTKLTNSGLTVPLTGDLTDKVADLGAAYTQLVADNNNGSGAAVDSTSSLIDVNTRINAVAAIKASKVTLEGITLGADIQTQALAEVDVYLTTATSNLTNVDTAIASEVAAYAFDNNKTRRFNDTALEGHIDSISVNSYSLLGSSKQGIIEDKATITGLDPVNAGTDDYTDLINTPLADALVDRSKSNTAKSAIEIYSYTGAYNSVPYYGVAAYAANLADSIGLCHAEIDGSANFNYATSADCSGDRKLTVSVASGTVTKRTLTAPETCTPTKNYIFVASGQSFDQGSLDIQGQGSLASEGFTFTFNYDTANPNNSSYSYNTLSYYTLSFTESDLGSGGLCFEW